MTNELKMIRRKRHETNMLDPIYVEGYTAENHFAPPYPRCPYPHNEELGTMIMRIALKEGRLTDDEKDQLRQLNGERARTKWARWTTGNYNRWCRESD